MKDLAPVERISSKIYLIRGQKVMLDRDLAELYGVETRVLKQAVKRNLSRFPSDFMFRLSQEEQESLRSHPVNITFFRYGGGPIANSRIGLKGRGRGAAPRPNWWNMPLVT